MVVDKYRYRGGRSRNRTAEELSLLLPVPLLLIVDGFASPSFPTTDRAAPSWDVGIRIKKSLPEWPTPPNLPIYINWKQWNDVAVPVLQDERVTGWRGAISSVGSIILLLNNVVGVDGTVLYPEGYEVGLTAFDESPLGRLFADDRSLGDRISGGTVSYLEELSGIIFKQATSKGY